MAEEENSRQGARTGRGRRSPYWGHFEQKAECNYCKALLCADPSRDGTSRMKKHYEETCPARHPDKHGRQHRQKQQAVPGDSAQNVSPHREEQSLLTPDKATSAQDQLVRMIALHGHPPSLVEDSQFVRFVGMLCPGFKMPSREDVENRCDALFDQEMTSLKDALRRAPGLVSLSICQADTSRGKVMFLAANFIDGEWNLRSRVVQVFTSTDEYDHKYENDFCFRLPGEDISEEDISEIKHYDRGFYPWNNFNCYRLIETISSWGLSSKISGVVSDFISKFNSEDDSRNIFRFGLFGKKLYGDNRLAHLSATQYNLLGATDICWVFHMAACKIIGPCEGHWVDAFEDLCLTKKKVREISSHLRLNHPWPYDSQWYSHYYALEILHHECSSAAEEFADLVGQGTFQETQTTELLRTTLGTIYRTMENFCASTSPISNICLIELLKVRKKLDLEYTKVYGKNEDPDDSDDDGQTRDAVDSDDSDDEVQRRYAVDGLRFAKRWMDLVLDVSYLSLSIPLVLDPRFKLVYAKSCLEKANLHKDQISNVEKAVRLLYTDYSKQRNGREHGSQGNDMEHTNHGNGMDIDTSQLGNGTSRQVINQSGMEQDHTSSPESWTELDDYLQDKRVPMKQEDFDILKWWKENCCRFPTVARMARDFLAIPRSLRPSPQQVAEITNHLRRYS